MKLDQQGKLEFLAILSALPSDKQQFLFDAASALYEAHRKEKAIGKFGHLSLVVDNAPEESHEKH